MSNNELENEQSASETSSCDKSMDRAAFIQKVLKGAALTGGALAAPKILDKFLIPPAYAGNSSGCVLGESTTSGGPDTINASGSSADKLEVRCNNNPGTSGEPCSTFLPVFAASSLCT